jgi:hypothetical protein
MKTTIKFSLVIMAIATFTTLQAQNNYIKGGPQKGILVPHTVPNSSSQYQNYSHPQSDSQNHWALGNSGSGSGWGPYGNITIGFSNYPYNPQPNYGYNYVSRKSARYAIKSAGFIIGEAIAFDTWNELFSPILAKAIRHYNYSRQLYWWGNYKAAINHAERAGYLAWYSLQCFQNPDYYNGSYGGTNYEPNPYSDPNNPYYRKSNPEAEPGKVHPGEKSHELPTQEKMDGSLPSNGIDDKEVIRTFDKSTLKDE